jgi:hypothetical protein
MKIRERAPWVLTFVLFWVALIACGDTSGTSGSAATGTPTANPSATETTSDSVANEESNDGFKKNIVQVVNKHPNKLRIKANIQLNRINGNEVRPVNAAIAVGQDCTGCQTIAVALQLDLYAKGSANVVSPENYAIALNVHCTSCVTVAHAVQYALGVDDPKQDVQDVRQLIDQMNKELNTISSDKDINADQAETRVRAVISQFNSLASSLREDVQRTVVTDSPSPSPSASASSSVSPSAGPSGSAPATEAPSPTPTATPSPTP